MGGNETPMFCFDNERRCTISGKSLGEFLTCSRVFPRPVPFSGEFVRHGAGSGATSPVCSGYARGCAISGNFGIAAVRFRIGHGPFAVALTGTWRTACGLPPPVCSASLRKPPPPIWGRKRGCAAASARKGKKCVPTPAWRKDGVCDAQSQGNFGLGSFPAPGCSQGRYDSQGNSCGSRYAAAQRHRFVSVTGAEAQSQGLWEPQRARSGLVATRSPSP